jgi:predicted RNase H-like nuclease
MTVLGVDWGHHEWAAVAIDDGDFVAGFTAPTIAAVEARALDEHGVSLIVVDIPIGLPDTGSRAADAQARARVGRRTSSVFPTPVHAALLADDHAAASAASVRATGKGLSTQGHGLRYRILTLDAFLPRARVRLLEGHPEVTFA